MKVNVTTSIDAIMHQKARDQNISWSDALEFGINFLVAEKEGVDYPPSRLMTKISNLQRVIAEKCEEIETLKSQSGFVTADKLSNEENEILSSPTEKMGICENCKDDYDHPTETKLFKVKNNWICGDCANSWANEKRESSSAYGSD